MNELMGLLGLGLMIALAGIVVLLVGTAGLEAMVRSVPDIVRLLWRVRGRLASWLYEIGRVGGKALWRGLHLILGLLWDAGTAALARLVGPPLQRMIEAIESRRAALQASRAASLGKKAAESVVIAEAESAQSAIMPQQQSGLARLDLDRAYAMLGLEGREKTTKGELSGRYADLTGKFASDDPRNEAILDMLTAARDIVRRARGWR